MINLLKILPLSAEGTSSGVIDIGSVMNNGMTLSEKLSLSVEMVFLGMAIVFAALSLVWLSVVVVRLLIVDLPKRLKDKKSSAGDISPETEVNPDIIDNSGSSNNNSDELTAVITAAVAAYLAGDGSQAGSAAQPAQNFKIVSFERKPRSRSWNGK